MKECRTPLKMQKKENVNAPQPGSPVGNGLFRGLQARNPTPPRRRRPSKLRLSRKTDVPVYHEWIGSLDGLVNADIRAQVTGYLIAQNYREGDPIKKGDLLFEIDPRPFQAVLDQAKGTLAQAEARLGKTELDVKRYAPLVKDNAISQEEYDDAVQADLEAQAAVVSAQGASRTGAVESWIYENRFAHRWRRQHRARPNRESGRPFFRRTDHGVNNRSDQSLLQRDGAGLHQFHKTVRGREQSL